MIGLGVWLGAIGLADLIAGFSGIPGSRRRALGGAAIATVAAAATVTAAGWDAAPGVAFTAWTALSVGAWLAARLPEPWSRRRAVVLLCAAVGAVVAMIVAAPAWPQAAAGPLVRLIDDLPYPAAARAGPELVILVTGIVAFLQASANAVVRLVLASTDSMLPPPEKLLLGGRVIGPIERTLVFAFALAGEPTAATLVASAKSILRFPEISGATASVTEYFLVGSMTSWLVALAPVALF